MAAASPAPVPAPNPVPADQRPGSTDPVFVAVLLACALGLAAVFLTYLR